MRWLAMIGLVVGVVLAAVGGARNGPEHTAHRQALLTVERAAVAEGDELEALAASLGVAADTEAVKAAAQAALTTAPLPAPAERLEQWLGAGGLPFGAGLLLVVGSALFLRRQHIAQVSGADGGDRADLAVVLAALNPALERLAAALEELEMDQPPPVIDGESATQWLDRLSAEQLQPLVDRRGELMARHGTMAFIGYFSPLSSAERSLARTWSALTDGHAVEARAALADARGWLVEAGRAWDALERDNA